MLRSAVDRAANYVLEADARNIQRALRRRALQQTCLFVEKHMYHTTPYRNKFDLLRAAIQQADLRSGLCCEFGVWGGSTINFIASHVQNTVYGFDSFEGLPEDWQPGVQEGSFRMNGLPRVRQNVRLIKGWFNETIPVFAQDHSANCAFLHVDCDLYSSTKTIFDVLGDRIVKGSVLVFDEFFNYPGWRTGEFLAFQQFVSARQLRFKYLGYVTVSEQVAVQITGGLS